MAAVRASWLQPDDSGEDLVDLWSHQDHSSAQKTAARSCQPPRRIHLPKPGAVDSPVLGGLGQVGNPMGTVLNRWVHCWVGWLSMSLALVMVFIDCTTSLV